MDANAFFERLSWEELSQMPCSKSFAQRKSPDVVVGTFITVVS